MSTISDPLSRETPRAFSTWLRLRPNAITAAAAAAHALVLDLSTSDLDAAAFEALQSSLRPARLLVQIGLPDRGRLDDALKRLRPDGVVLVDTRSGACLQQMGARLAVHEAECGLPDGVTAVIALVSSAAGLLGLADLRGASRRLTALTWDETALRADLGGEAGSGAVVDEAGSGAVVDAADSGAVVDAADPIALARAGVLVAARGLGVQPIDTAAPGASASGLAQACDRARRMGFSGKIAVSPEQVAIIRAGGRP